MCIHIYIYTNTHILVDIYIYLYLQGEIQQVLDLGVNSSRIIYANPCKQNSHLEYAAQNNVSLMTFDSELELLKIKQLYPTSE